MLRSHIVSFLHSLVHSFTSYICSIYNNTSTFLSNTFRFVREAASLIISAQEDACLIALKQKTTRSKRERNKRPEKATSRDRIDGYNALSIDSFLCMYDIYSLPYHDRTHLSPLFLHPKPYVFILLFAYPPSTFTHRRIRSTASTYNRPRYIRTQHTHILLRSQREYRSLPSSSVPIYLPPNYYPSSNPLKMSACPPAFPPPSHFKHSPPPLLLLKLARVNF